MLAIGTRLGPYEILSMLGAGGMGEVYLAQDTRLSRRVAIKVLSAQLAASIEARQRFEREAHAISRLSHPNICTLHDIGQASPVTTAEPQPAGIPGSQATTPQPGVLVGETVPAAAPMTYLVMEYLQGESLAQRIERGPLPLPDVLRYGIEIASALDRAHQAGIVHRDLKPGNIMLTPTGAKLLDFGLAKAFGAHDFLSTPDAGAAAPELTREGEIQGTLSYMAPEQLQGLATDARTDIYALGAVLREMATGQRTFTGRDPASLIAAIMSGHIDPIAPGVAPTLPRPLERLVQTCLARDPAQRWQAARDVGLHLVEIDSFHDLPQPPSQPRRAWAPWLLAAALALVAGWLVLKAPQPAERAPILRYSLSTAPGVDLYAATEGRYFAISPDGRMLAFLGTTGGSTSIQLRRLDSLDATPLPGTEGAMSLAWSPDSRRLAFFTRTQLLRVDVDGASPPVELARISPGSGYSATWGAQGQIVYARISGEALYGVATTGGTPQILLKVDDALGDSRLTWPSFLADGRRLLYLRHGEDGSKELRLYEPGKPTRHVADIASDARAVADGSLIYVRDGTLLAQGFDADTAQVFGEPRPIATDVGYFYTTGHAAFSAADSGMLVFQRRSGNSRLQWFDRNGLAQGTLGNDGAYLNVVFSPDGRRLMFDRTVPGPNTYDVWMLEFGSGGETRVTSNRDTEIAGVWMPDANALIYSQSRGHGPQMRLHNLISGEDHELAPQAGFQIPQDVSPDRRVLAFIERGAAGQFEAWTLELDGERRRLPLYPSGFQQTSVRFSPDGRYVAYIANDTGRNELYLAPYPEPGARVRVSANGASGLRWPRGSGEIVYVSGDQRLISVPIETEPTLAIGPASTLFVLDDLGWNSFDISADGQKLLAIVPLPDAERSSLTIVTGLDPAPAH